jgi:hypothetical protein
MKSALMALAAMATLTCAAQLQAQVVVREQEAPRPPAPPKAPRAPRAAEAEPAPIAPAAPRQRQPRVQRTAAQPVAPPRAQGQQGTESLPQGWQRELRRIVREEIRNVVREEIERAMREHGHGPQPMHGAQPPQMQPRPGLAPHGVPPMRGALRVEGLPGGLRVMGARALPGLKLERLGDLRERVKGLLMTEDAVDDEECCEDCECCEDGKCDCCEEEDQKAQKQDAKGKTKVKAQVKEDAKPKVKTLKTLDETPRTFKVDVIRATDKKTDTKTDKKTVTAPAKKLSLGGAFLPFDGAGDVQVEGAKVFVEPQAAKVLDELHLLGVRPLDGKDLRVYVDTHIEPIQLRLEAKPEGSKAKKDPQPAKPRKVRIEV